MFAALLLVGSASAATVDFRCEAQGEAGSPGGIGIVGVPPLTVSCSAILPSQGDWDQVSWTFGDGSVQTGESATFTYDEVGQYAISVRLDGFTDPAEPDALDPQEVRQAFVTVCGPPEPEFAWKNKGGLRYALSNESVIAPFCLDDSKWEVFRGRTADGAPAMTFETWAPRFELPREGPWLVRLTETGLAGTAVADHVIQAKYQLTDDLKDLPSYACSTTPSGLASGSGLALLGALLARRSRRR